jgi:hypothetical protein
MAYPETPPAQPAAPRARPTTVTAAVYSLYALAALQLLSIIAALAVIGPSIKAVEDFVPAGDDRDLIVTSTRIGTYVGIGFAVLFAIAWVVLAIFDGKGKQPARIVTWVLGGLFLCCVSLSLIGTAAGNLIGGGGEVNGIDQDELTRRIEDATPGWAHALSTVSSVLQLLLALAAVILLALPASHDFFRKPQAEWQPPVDGGYYPPAAQ